jgi:glycosyltransferase involved in cell wall biosynthesis
MKALIQTRPGLNAFMTGDVTQIRATAEALANQGVEVCFSDSLEPDVAGIDVVHLFSTLEPHFTFKRLKYLLDKKVPTVVSTIYWEWEPDELRRETDLCLGQSRSLAGKLLNILRNQMPHKLRYRLSRSPLPYHLQKVKYELEKSVGLMGMRKYIYENADVLLPNSHAEYHYLVKRFGINNEYLPIPNAVNPEFAVGNAEAFYNKFGLRDFVLCVAVVTMRKNQARLIRAMKEIDVPLVIIGSQERKYFELCRSEASTMTHFLGELRGEDLRNAYAAAKVHALVSFYETPGLSSLEAAISGNVLVVSDRGCTREYFKENAFYCDPSDENSIKNAIHEALRVSPDDGFKQRVLNDYNWDKTAEMTLKGYELAIQKKQSCRNGSIR